MDVVDGNDCIDLSGDPIEPTRLVNIYAGKFRYYFDSKELTKVLLISGHNKNPYTGVPLWQTREEFEAIFSTNISEADKVRLDHKFWNAAFRSDLRYHMILHIDRVRKLLSAARSLESFHYAFDSKEYRQSPKQYVKSWFRRSGMCGLSARMSEASADIRSGDYGFEPYVPAYIFDILQFSLIWFQDFGLFYIRDGQHIDYKKVIIDAGKSGRGNEIIDMILTTFYHLEIPTEVIDREFVNLKSKRIYATCYYSSGHLSQSCWNTITVAHVINDKFLFDNTTEIVDIADYEKMTFSTPKIIDENLIPWVFSTSRLEYMNMRDTLVKRIE
jgi:hypothetical protein